MTKTDIHVTIHEYQDEYLEDQGYNKSAVIRDLLDDKIARDGGDPDSWEESHGG